MQHDFQYVPKKQVKELKTELRNLIHEVQDEVQKYFTFQYKVVGSASRDMVTQDLKSNKGFDFDVNFYPNDDEEEFKPKEIRDIFRNALNRIAPKYGYGWCEDSTRVLTIKVVDLKKSAIVYSCDFAIVFDCDDGRQQYIRYNKKKNEYSWEYQPQGYQMLDEKIQWLKQQNLWTELKKYYLRKKNFNKDKNKKSRAIFAETIHEMCMKYGYYC